MRDYRKRASTGRKIRRRALLTSIKAFPAMRWM
jgi:hypothetical protein